MHKPTAIGTAIIAAVSLTACGGAAPSPTYVQNTYVLAAGSPATIAADSASGAASTTKVLTPPAKLEFSKATPDGVVLTDGKEGDEYDRTYACRAGTIAIEAPVNKTVSANGVTISVAESNPARKFYDDQDDVTLKIKTDKNSSVLAIIVNTGAHSRRPDLYPQTAHRVSLGVNGNIAFTLSPYLYATNYENEGITAVTACITNAS